MYASALQSALLEARQLTVSPPARPYALGAILPRLSGLKGLSSSGRNNSLAAC